MQAITRRPVLSFSSLKSLTAHWRHAPTDPIAGMPAKIRQIKPQREARFEQVFTRLYVIRLLIDINAYHDNLPPRGIFLIDEICSSKSLSEIFQCALQQHQAAPRCKRAERIARSQKPRMHFEQFQVSLLTFTAFHRKQYFLCPRQSFPAGAYTTHTILRSVKKCSRL